MAIYPTIPIPNHIYQYVRFTSAHLKCSTPFSVTCWYAMTHCWKTMCYLSPFGACMKRNIKCIGQLPCFELLLLNWQIGLLMRRSASGVNKVYMQKENPESMEILYQYVQNCLQKMDLAPGQTNKADTKKKKPKKHIDENHLSFKVRRSPTQIMFFFIFVLSKQDNLRSRKRELVLVNYKHFTKTILHHIFMPQTIFIMPQNSSSPQPWLPMKMTFKMTEKKVNT